MALYKIHSCTENNLVTRHFIGCWWASEGNKCILEYIRPHLSGGWIRTGPLFRVMWKQKLKNSKPLSRPKTSNHLLCSETWHYVILQFLDLIGLKWHREQSVRCFIQINIFQKGKGLWRSSLFAWYDLKWGQIPGSVYRYFYKIDFLF